MARVVKFSKYLTLKNIALFFVATVAYAVFFQLLYNALAHGKIWVYPNFPYLVDSFLRNYIPILLLSVCNVLIVFQLPIPKRLERRIFPKSLLDLTISLGVLYIINLLYVWILGFLTPYTHIYSAGTVLSDLLILLFVEIAYYVCLSRALSREAEKHRTRALQYQYDALKAQINPHFLFNSLNILYSLIDLDREKSKAFTNELATVYRHVLSFRNRSEITLSEELELIRAYVEILRMRYHRQFAVKYSGNEKDAGSRRIIPYTVQLLIENVTKHNVVSSAYPMEVTIAIGSDSLTVTNPIRPKPVMGRSEGMGLQYIGSQYRLHGKSISIVNDGKTFTAKIPYI